MYLNSWHIYGVLGVVRSRSRRKRDFFLSPIAAKINLETIEFDDPPKNTPLYEVSNIYKRFIKRKSEISNKKSEKV